MSKRVDRFYVGHLGISQAVVQSGATFTIQDAPLVHQLVKVLRLHKGDKVALFWDNSDDYHCEITEVGKREVTMQLQTTNPAKPLAAPGVTMVIPKIKRDRLLLAVEKLTELGVKEIVFIETDHTTQAHTFSLEKVTARMIEACEQCGRSELVTLKEVVNLEVAIKETADQQQVAAVINNETAELTAVSKKAVACFIGPEGGWSEREVKLLADHSKINLGNLILRTETAAVAAVVKLIL